MNEPSMNTIQEMCDATCALAEAAIKSVNLNRSAHASMRHHLWNECLDKRAKAKFFRDFCTVRLALPARSGLSSWAYKFLTSEDLLITRFPDSLCKAKMVERLSQVKNLQGSSFRYIVIDQFTFTNAQSAEVYESLGVDPELQTFIFLGYNS